MNKELNSTGDWKPEVKAELFVKGILDKCFNNNEKAKKFKEKLLDKAAIKFRDLIDHFTFDNESLIQALESQGWIHTGNTVFKNKNGYFPDFIFSQKKPQVCFRVEFVDEFFISNQINTKIKGAVGGQFRKALVFNGNEVDFYVIERHGTELYEITKTSKSLIRSARIHQQNFRVRHRTFDKIDEGFEHLNQLVENAVEDIGKDWACDLFLRAEREYWMTRNTVGRIQKKRQDKLGIGWANQDHHTFDSSREHFYKTINILEKLGFECRELFYAGAGAGWGSQILEQPVLKSVIFADIDLAPEELGIDFAHDKDIKPLYPLRRAGLWCAMHGESMLEAGLNHLECMYDAQKLNEQFKDLNVKMMEPFSDFPHLYQALTIGEWWPVESKRIDDLEREGHITTEAAENFRQFGAIGSHFENLERNEGFKGFNQPGIDDVLRIIDPRKQLK